MPGDLELVGRCCPPWCSAATSAPTASRPICRPACAR